MEKRVSAMYLDMLCLVADRVNFELFTQYPVGSAVRIGGRLFTAMDGSEYLTTTDGGVLSVAGCTINSMKYSMSDSVEILGMKTGESMIDAAGMWQLGEDVDVEVWESALKVLSRMLMLSSWRRLPARYISRPLRQLLEPVLATSRKLMKGRLLTPSWQ